jgi:hypothetical protein
VSIGGKLAEIPNDLVFILIGPESEQLFQTPVAQPAGGALARPSAFS